MPARAALLLTLLASSAAAEAAPHVGQLPKGAVPLHYDIAIDPDAKALAFTGQETITVSTAAATRRLVLNAADLTIGGVQVDGIAARWAIDAKGQRLTITPAHALKAGTHRIAIGWTGTISQSSAGLFAIDYQDAHGPQRMLVTQFEPSDARRFAPMWDEPGRKATFTLTTTAPAGQTAFSNMPVASTAKAAGGKTRVTFQQTPNISSYLIFLGIGDVDRRTARVGTTEIGVITRRGAADQGAYALASAKRLLAYYNDYFGTPYPLPKLDMIAGPGSSQVFGAMENWGAIFYFERDILLDPALSTESDRQNVFTAIAHEMAHQWFGDLVTMAWWDDLWLNEGYAEWMQGKASAALNPDWHLDERTISGARQNAFQADSRRGTHSIVQTIDTPEQANQAFDTITYLKGEAVIRMLEGAVGEDAFRAGVRRYMAAHKYGNTVTDDLWASIGAASGKPVKPLMDAFTRQVGVPLIRVGAPACAAGQTTLTLAQDRYATDDTARTPQLWPVPVALKGAGATQIDVKGATARPVTLAGCAPIVVNPGQYGYYRTLYTPGHFEALGHAFAALPLADQIGILLDRVYLANAGYVPLDGALALLGRIPADADPLMWTAIATRLRAYDELLRGDAAQPAFRIRASAMLAPQLARVGFAGRPGDTPPLSQLREDVIAALGVLGDPAVVAEARRLVTAGMNTIPAAIRQPMVQIFAENAGGADWDMLHAAARSETNPLIRQSLYKDLGRARDETLVQRALDLALTDEAPVPFRADMIAAAASTHPALVFDWAVAHADAVNVLVEPASRQQFIPGLAAAANDDATAARLEAYVNRAIPADGRRAAAATIGQIHYSARVKARVRAPLAVWADAR